MTRLLTLCRFLLWYKDVRAEARKACGPEYVRHMQMRGWWRVYKQSRHKCGRVDFYPDFFLDPTAASKGMRNDPTV